MLENGVTACVWLLLYVVHFPCGSCWAVRLSCQHLCYRRRRRFYFLCFRGAAWGTMDLHPTPEPPDFITCTAKYCISLHFARFLSFLCTSPVTTVLWAFSQTFVICCNPRKVLFLVLEIHLPPVLFLLIPATEVTLYFPYSL